jgi:hypothetical protein
MMFTSVYDYFKECTVDLDEGSEVIKEFNTSKQDFRRFIKDLSRSCKCARHKTKEAQQTNTDIQKNRIVESTQTYLMVHRCCTGQMRCLY